MNPLPFNSQPGKKSSASESIDKTVPPRESNTVLAHMAATVSRPVPQHHLQPLSREFRPQLPPLLPPIHSSFQPTTTNSSTGATSPTSATSSTQSWAQLAHQHPLMRNQPPSITAVTSPSYPPRLHGSETSLARQASPTHGVKRPFEATRDAKR